MTRYIFSCVDFPPEDLVAKHVEAELWRYVSFWKLLLEADSVGSGDLISKSGKLRRKVKSSKGKRAQRTKISEGPSETGGGIRK